MKVVNLMSFCVFVCVLQAGFYEEQNVYAGGFWPQADASQGLVANPRSRGNKPLSPPTSSHINNQV